MKTLREVSKETGIKFKTLQNRMTTKQIKGKKRSTKFYYTKEQIQQITNPLYYREKLPKYSNPSTTNIDNQLLVHRYYQYDLSYSKIAELVNITKSNVAKIIYNFKRNDDFLIIQSKINKPNFV
jgi:DNA-binding Lrp family transcriptional regulator